MILAQRAFELIKAGQHLRIGDPVLSHDVPHMAEVLLGFYQAAGGPAGVRHLSRRQRYEVEYAGHLRIVMGHDPPQLREVEGFFGAGDDSLLAFRDQMAHEEGAPEALAGAVHSTGPIPGRKGHQLFEVLSRLTLLRLQAGYLFVEKTWEELQRVHRFGRILAPSPPLEGEDLAPTGS